MHHAAEVTAVPRDIRQLCTHVFAGGRLCASPALRHERFCYYHHPTRKPAANHNERHARRIARQSFACPIPANRREFQVVLGELMNRIASNEIDLRRAGLLLQALQITFKNLNGS